MDTPYATRHLASVSSTQDDARRAFRGRPLLVIADRQSAGRGRSGSDWLQAPRAVFASLAFASDWPPESRGALSLLAGLAARDALGGRLWLKWPNDLLDDAGAKVGGLLAEGESGTALVVIGFGANLWWPDAPAGFGAWSATDPGSSQAATVAAAWAAGVLTRVAAGPADWGRAEYRSACSTLGGEVTWEGGGTGRAVDVDPEGALVVATAGGTMRLTAGEVRHVRSATLPRRPGPEVQPDHQPAQS